MYMRSLNLTAFSPILMYRALGRGEMSEVSLVLVIAHNAIESLYLPAYRA